jgi:exonuclease SbcC
MKIAHISDLHCCREHAEEALVSLRFFAAHIKKSPADLVCISGDIWDASMLNTEASGFTRFVEAIRDIAGLAPVAMIYGTPSHDTDGSLEIFRNITSKHGITILEPGQAYFLHGDGTVISESQKYTSWSGITAVLFGIPEPRKKYLLAETSAGKDETEEAIRAAMRKMCFLLGAKRREYPDIPCVTLYHGDVAGSALQNGQTVERGTGIAVTIDDLASIGADYYALGHIHKPQRVGSLPAYYAGSIYPKNFGETHQAGFNMADVESSLDNEHTVLVTAVDFPHPKNMKIEVGGDTFDGTFILPKYLTGFRVWLEITCPREMRAFVNAGKHLRHLLDNGAAEGSRVTINDIPAETIRAAEITAVTTPEDKFKVWAENSAVESSESVIEKIKGLYPGIKLSAASGWGEWELASVRLRGAAGIKRGIKKDEIALNFDGYSPGLIALCGANGKGKTTLIENCHPYPQVFTRKGKLQDQFCLRDSFREVILRDRLSGMMIKFLIQVDGANKSGSCRYFAFRKEAGAADWEPFEGVDGNLKPYEELLMRTFGPLDLFLRTAFITQRPMKNLPDLTDATAGEKKTLFVELAGIDYLQRFADAAAEKAKEEEEKAHDAEIRARALEEAATGKEAAERELKEAETALAAGRRALDESVMQGKAARETVDRLQADCETERLRRREADSAQAAITAAEKKKKEFNGAIEGYARAAARTAEFEKQTAEAEELQKTIEAENAKKRQILERNAEKQREFAKIKAEFDAKAKELEKERDGMRDRRRVIETAALQARNNIRLYERDAAEIKEDCPTCGQRLPPEKLAELKNRREEFLSRIERETAALAKFNEELENVSSRLEETCEKIAALAFEEPEPEKDLSFDDAALREASLKFHQISLPEVRASLRDALGAAVKIDELRRRVTDEEKIIRERTAEYERLTAGIEAGYCEKISAELEEAKRLHDDLLNRYAEVKADIARDGAVIEAAKRKLAEIAAHEKERAELGGAIRLSKTEAAEWELIAKAFGRDSIQALELDALAPGISDTANRILESAYGDRFRIEIQTTRIGGAGKKTKQIEDFLIYVTDSEDGGGEPVLLENKSGGEAVWIKRAIYDAFAVIRKRNTAFAFLTCFQDETDGALDGAAKTAYCRMLEAAHAESKLRHTVIITHSNEVKAMIEQKIEMDGFAEAV